MEAYLPLGRARVVEAADGVVGTALWRWPDEELGTGEVLPSYGGLLTAIVGPGHLRRLAAGFAALDAARPTAPHAYLHYLGVDAAHRGQGHGRRLVEEGLARAAADGLPVRLETAKERNVEIYRRLGFAVHSEVRVGDGPRMWVMTAATGTA